MRASTPRRKLSGRCVSLPQRPLRIFLPRRRPATAPADHNTTEIAQPSRSRAPAARPVRYPMLRTKARSRGVAVRLRAASAAAAAGLPRGGPEARQRERAQARCSRQQEVVHPTISGYWPVGLRERAPSRALRVLSEELTSREGGEGFRLRSFQVGSAGRRRRLRGTSPGAATGSKRPTSAALNARVGSRECAKPHE